VRDAGSYLSPLSLLELGNDPFDASTVNTYDSEFYTRQLRKLGIPISALPFNISPFDVIELARDEAPAKVRLILRRRGGDEIWINPKNDVREVLVSRDSCSSKVPASEKRAFLIRTP
jgi:hypothetical protein